MCILFGTSLGAALGTVLCVPDGTSLGTLLGIVLGTILGLEDGTSLDQLLGRSLEVFFVRSFVLGACAR